jgi:hypothetical protein
VVANTSAYTWLTGSFSSQLSAFSARSFGSRKISLVLHLCTITAQALVRALRKPGQVCLSTRSSQASLSFVNGGKNLSVPLRKKNFAQFSSVHHSRHTISETVEKSGRKYMTENYDRKLFYSVVRSSSIRASITFAACTKVLSLAVNFSNCETVPNYYQM